MAGAGARWRAGRALVAGLAAVLAPVLALAQPKPPAPAAVPASAATPAAEAAQQVLIQGSADGDTRRRLATAALSIVGREELDAQGDLSVLDVLERQAGISIEGDTPRLGGLGDGYTVVLINGEPAPPGFSLASLAPADIERVEIIKGPSAEYGGTAGAINIVLRGPPKLNQREWRSSLGARGGRALSSVHFGWGGRSGALGWHLPLGANRWAGATRLQAERVSRSPQGTVSRQALAGRDLGEGTDLNFAPRLDWRPGPQDQVQAQWLFRRNRSHNLGQRETVALAGPPPYSVRDETGSQARYAMARSQAQWVHKLADGRQFDLKGTAQSSLWQQQGRAQGVSPAGTPRPLRENTQSLREGAATLGARWRQPWGEAHALSAGVDLEDRRRRELRRQFDDGLERIVGGLGRASTAGTERQTLFLQDDWDVGPHTALSAGLRASRTRLLSTGPEGDFTQRYSALLPVLNLRHAFDDAGRRLLRLGVSRSQRVPDLALLQPRYALNGQYDRATANTPIAADSAGNPALTPERSTGFDLAYEHHLPASAGVASVSLSHRRIDQLIRRRIGLENVPEASVPRWVSRPVNLGRARSSGLDVEWKGRLQPGLNLRLAASAYRSSVEQIDDPDARLEGQAPWRASLGFDQLVPGTRWTWGASLVLQPAYATQQSDLQRQTRNASRRLDAFVLWRASRELQLRLAGTNLLADDSLNASSVADIDGFAASADTRRQTLASVNASLVWRF